MSQPAKDFPAPGQNVKMNYKSGVYIGEVMEISGPRAVVKVLAVLKHPEQGDLHNPYNPDVPMFHERRALSYTEKALALINDLQPYSGHIPDYRESLMHAVESELADLERLRRWADRSIQQLEALRSEY
ncbi:kinase-associated lipoprotein B [Paenibacillus tarimensis]|uniref:kinase-associated lipoprotein B n=1 Tax=Paenibacillus tarimensis TaxID=416012 RepID=UPI001F3ADFDF|nr:kinase-associated lipoprotein B [Paenibacillus tarimensis]MCF2944983.1 kinase-associated lipoprotein B [Paenibacillus tarimensis]